MAGGSGAGLLYCCVDCDKDQNGTVHTYDLDDMGRVTQDRVTTVGTGIDNAVLRISTTYDIRGLREKISSYDNATVGSGNVVNEVVYEYNDMGMPVKEYQEHEGAKDASTLYVGYNYDTAASSGEYTKGLRRSSVRYPNSRLVHFTYGTSGSTADAMNRVDAINDDSSGSAGDSFSEYDYLGGGRIVVEDYTEPDVRLNYDSGTAGEYAGFDRFGRVVDHLWYDYGASANRDQFTYGYDRASNRTYRENTSVASKDEFYTYDDANRLATYDRGDLNTGKDAISGTPVDEEDWGLDMTGNWSDFTQKSSGSTDLDQDRTHNAVNEIRAISETVGTSWIEPVHDQAGNMTTVPKPSSLSSGLTCKWDAWNHLVEVKDGATVIAKYEYDGLARRVKKHLDSESPASPDGIDAYIHYFYNGAWQTLETRRSTSENTGPESLQPKCQYVWSQRYIDAPILRDENTDSDGTCDDERVYYLGDANFNVTTLVDTAGDAIERYTYSPYGVLAIHDATWSNVRSTSSYAVEYTYTGRRVDPETGLYYYRHRYYAPELGRFCSRDPIGYEGSWWNLFEYGYGHPISALDPGGLECTSWFFDPKTWTGQNTGHFGSFYMSLNYTVRQGRGLFTVCDACCDNGTTGTSIELKYGADVDVTGAVGVSWQWNGLLGLGVLNPGVTGEIFANGRGSLSIEGTWKYCPALAPTGSVQMCGRPFAFSVGGRILSWANVPGYSLQATISGAVTYPARFCATINLQTATVSQLHAQITGPGSGGIRFYGQGHGIGFNRSFDTCLLGNCAAVP